MASIHRILLLPLSIWLVLLAIGADARPGVHFHPCKTLFISYSISSFRIPLDLPQNPNLPHRNPSDFVAVFMENKEFEPKPFFPSAQIAVDRPDFPFRHSDQIPHHAPFGSFGFSSLRERTKDILSVVVALLFGVGCGALTSATMYLAWSLITNRYEICDREDEDDEEFDHDDDIKRSKMGYVKIPAAPAASPVPAPAKEVAFSHSLTRCFVKNSMGEEIGRATFGCEGRASVMAEALTVRLGVQLATRRAGVHFHLCKTLFISYYNSFSIPLDLPQNPNYAELNPFDFLSVVMENKEFESSLTRPICLWQITMRFSNHVPFGSFGFSSFREVPKTFLASWGLCSLVSAVAL
ncbi:hypothetical protein HHK36_024105 [Tetracentron sinense]|uniref:Uncharacterized protein n=1 Tax=Tetracentron sinense TaxID=13715 RepID=A0A834YN58_TETSI|nr:hypothetical protein HHK36_024105 [Tetracentron sinense]